MPFAGFFLIVLADTVLKCLGLADTVLVSFVVVVAVVVGVAVGDFSLRVSDVF